MNKLGRRLLLSTLLATTACGSSKPGSNDGSSGSTGTAGSGGAGTTGAAGSSAGSTGTGGGGAMGTAGADGGAGTTGTAGADASADTTGAAGSDASSDVTGAAGSDAAPGDTSAATDASGDAASASGLITMAAGGALMISNGSFKIQAASLAADTTISIAASAPTGATPQQATVLGDVLELGPTGTLFTKPALLTLSLGAVPSGKHAVVSTLVANAWVDLPSVVANGKVYASLSHLSTYAARAVDDVPCGTTFTADVACGTGTLTGTWNVASFCNANLDTTEFPATDKLLQACADTGTSTPITAGSATLNADLTYSTNLVPPTRATLSIMLSAACTSAAASCDAVAGQIVSSGAFVDAACTGTPAAGCLCTGVYRPPVLPAISSGNYTATGGKLGFTGSLPARLYCANNASTPQKLYYSWGSTGGAQSPQFGFIFTK